MHLSYSALSTRYIPAVVLLALVLCASLVLAAPKPPEGPIAIKPPAGAVLKKSVVQFPHAKHGELDCTVCHHTLASQPKTYTCSAPACHDLANPTDKAAKKSMAYFRNAYHAPAATSCNGCHKARKTEGKKAGPTDCKGCHP